MTSLFPLSSGRTRYKRGFAALLCGSALICVYALRDADYSLLAGQMLLACAAAGQTGRARKRQAGQTRQAEPAGGK